MNRAQYVAPDGSLSDPLKDGRRDHAPSVAAPASLREAGQALSDAIADMAAEGRLFVDAAVGTDIRFLDTLKAFRAALRAESVAAPAGTEQLSGEHEPHRGNHIDYACGFSGPHCWECGEPWPCRTERGVSGGPARHAPPALDAARQSEKERLAQALRDGDMETFTAAIRKANVHHCCSGCNASGHCTHGYESGAATPASGEPAAACVRGSNPKQGIDSHWCLTHDAEWLLNERTCSAAAPPAAGAEPPR